MELKLIIGFCIGCVFIWLILYCIILRLRYLGIELPFYYFIPLTAFLSMVVWVVYLLSNST